MKKAFSILMLCVFFFGCKIKEKPEFIGVEYIGIAKVSLDTINLKANAIFKNGNDLGGTLLSDEIKVFIDSAYVATVSSKAFKVPPRDEFTVPLLVKFPVSKLIQEGNGGLFGTILKRVLNNKVIVSFKGELTYKLAGVSFDYPIDHREEIIIE
ncbi:MAG: hypothetical protein WBM77_04365 [Maribacter sp.]